jgi:pimeloyl-ACP methyl ester carboxylesterase
MALQESNVTAVRDDGRASAVVFVHGFSGERDDTWDRFPGLVGSATPDWDIFTVGYATTLLPDVVGIWSADPDLPILASMLRTQLGTPPFSQYQSLALIAHSMGGLVVQKALVDDATLGQRVRHVILFGTPSNGLRKAGWAPFWKRQLQNMAQGSSFIADLRREWTRLYSPPPFNFLTVAGASDQFVPPDSSLGPFDTRVQRVVPGDHVSIVKPSNADAPSLALLVATLQAGAAPAPDPVSQLRLAAERPSAKVVELVQHVETTSDWMSVKSIVDVALALDRAGRRDESVAFLERYKDQDSDIKGVLAGRMKRLWFDTEKPTYAERALALYEEALRGATTADHISYLAINVAFMKLVFVNDPVAARAMATIALEHASSVQDEVWRTATIAEAHLYHERVEQALAEYRRLLTLQTEPWKHHSASLQASRVATKLGRHELVEALERLKVMMAPYLHAAESELDLWDDTRLSAGQQWDAEIERALAKAGVAVALVSPDFLGSTYVMEKELPAIIKAAKGGGASLLWVYISDALWEETPLKEFQATHDTKMPLDARPRAEQNQILKSVAKQIKQAALGATERFKKLAS